MQIHSWNSLAWELIWVLSPHFPPTSPVLCDVGVGIRLFVIHVIHPILPQPWFWAPRADWL